MTKPTAKHTTLTDLADAVANVTDEHGSRVYEIVYATLAELERAEPGALPRHLANDLRTE